ncbi:GDSL esterase/lipase At3g62280-like [Salvia splendens]|uniref:GDSL esterase/lipase At3g62280-like n=1 Tax=Salvia splendens TaxID=180675 RepID=UPI001C268544|nr:GDSL esterase/lipase At3g62280-like [Salvia splendens]
MVVSQFFISHKNKLKDEIQKWHVHSLCHIINAGVSCCFTVQQETSDIQLRRFEFRHRLPCCSNGIRVRLSGLFHRPTGRLCDGRLIIDFLCKLVQIVARKCEVKLFESVSGIIGGYKNLVGEDGFKNAIYMIDIGQNDLTPAFNNVPYDQVLQKIPSFISEIKEAMWVSKHHSLTMTITTRLRDP